MRAFRLCAIRRRDFSQLNTYKYIRQRFVVVVLLCTIFFIIICLCFTLKRFCVSCRVHLFTHVVDSVMMRNCIYFFYLSSDKTLLKWYCCVYHDDKYFFVDHPKKWLDLVSNNTTVDNTHSIVSSRHCSDSHSFQFISTV